MAFGSLIKGAIKGFTISGGNPLGAFTGAVQQKRQDKFKRQAQEMESYKPLEPLTTHGGTSMAIDPSQMIGQRSSIISSPPAPMGFFDRIGNIASNVGNTLLTGFEQALPTILTQRLGGKTAQTVLQQPAFTTTGSAGAQESQGSGSIQAGAGSLLAPVLQATRSLIKSPAGQLALGGGAGFATSMIGSQGRTMRVTRKMKSQLKSLLRMTNNDYALVGDFLNLNQDQMLFILNKRFRNDGPVVTKAALRKTKQTIRRLHSMQDVLKSITPTATMRRRAPMKRASTTTLIKN